MLSKVRPYFSDALPSRPYLTDVALSRFYLIDSLLVGVDQVGRVRNDQLVPHVLEDGVLGVLWELVRWSRGVVSGEGQKLKGEEEFKHL